MFLHPIKAGKPYLCKNETAMKTRTSALPAAALLCIGTVSCQGPALSQEGSISIRIASNKSLDLPDTEDYILSITDGDGNSVYHGRFGDSPEELKVSSGTYTVSAASGTFEEARFEAPLLADSKEVFVGAGEKVSASLLCSQTNCGVRLRAEESFTEAFPDGILYVKGEGGRLMYGYPEKRTGYFNPGKITVSVSSSGKEQSLLSRELQEGEMLTLDLSASSGSGEGLRVRTDTSRKWTSASYIWGEDEKEEDGFLDALDISMARESAGAEDVWVKGYIVGCAASAGKLEFDPPFSKGTNILLGLRSGTSDGKWCISVELKNKKIRQALNLQENRELDGEFIYMKGDLVSSYYGLPGLKNVSEYKFGY